MGDCELCGVRAGLHVPGCEADPNKPIANYLRCYDCGRYMSVNDDIVYRDDLRGSCMLSLDPPEWVPTHKVCYVKPMLPEKG